MHAVVIGVSEPMDMPGYKNIRGFSHYQKILYFWSKLVPHSIGRSKMPESDHLLHALHGFFIRHILELGHQVIDRLSMIARNMNTRDREECWICEEVNVIVEKIFLIFLGDCRLWFSQPDSIMIAGKKDDLDMGRNGCEGLGQ